MASLLAVDLVAFDMGGTTVLDDGIVPLALRRALEPLGIIPTDAAIAAVRGAAKRMAIATLVHGSGRFGEDEIAAAIDAAHARFAAELRRAYADGPIAEAPGASDLFAWLRQAGVKVALTTGFDRPTRDLLLRRLGWDDGRIDAAVSAEEVAAGRPAPDMLIRAMALTGVRDARRLAAVGDTALDLEAGTNAGAGFVVGVLGGAHDRATLERAPHTHILPRLADLRRILV